MQEWNKEMEDYLRENTKTVSTPVKFPEFIDMDITIFEKIMKKMEHEPRDLWIASYNHRDIPSESEIGISTYVRHETWKLVKKMGCKVLEKSEPRGSFLSGMNHVVITKDKKIIRFLKEDGYKRRRI